MARTPRELTLDYTPEALQDLDEIWEWNAGQRGKAHADRYISFLKSETARLAARRNPGRPVEKREGYRYETIRRRSQGYGHVAIFERLGSVLRVLRYFHTSQDWENKLPQDPE